MPPSVKAPRSRPQTTATLSDSISAPPEGTATPAVAPNLPLEVTPLLRAKLAVIQRAVDSGVVVGSVDGAAVIRRLLEVADRTSHTGSIRPSTSLSAVPLPILTETFATANIEEENNGEGNTKAGVVATSEMLTISHLVGAFGILPGQVDGGGFAPPTASSMDNMWRIQSCPVPIWLPNRGDTDGASLVRDVYGDIDAASSASQMQAPGSPTGGQPVMMPTIPGGGDKTSTSTGKKGASKHGGGGADTSTSKSAPSSKNIKTPKDVSLDVGGKPTPQQPSAPGNSSVGLPSTTSSSSLLGMLGDAIMGQVMGAATQPDIDAAITQSLSNWIATRMSEAVPEQATSPTTTTAGNNEGSVREARRGDPPPPPLVVHSPAELQYQAISTVSAAASRLAFFLSCSAAEVSLICGGAGASSQQSTPKESALGSLSRLFAPFLYQQSPGSPMINMLGKTPRVPTPIVAYDSPIFVVPPHRKGATSPATPAPDAQGGGYPLTCSPHSHNGRCSSVGECIQAITDLDRAIRRRCRLANDRYFRASFPPWGTYSPEACDGRTLDQSIRLALSDMSEVLSQVNLLPQRGSGVHHYPAPSTTSGDEPSGSPSDVDSTSILEKRVLLRKQALAGLIAAQKATTTDLDVAVVDPLAMINVGPWGQGVEKPVSLSFFQTLSELVHDIAIMKKEGIAVVLDLQQLLLELPVSQPQRVVLSSGTSSTCTNAPPSELFWIPFSVWCDVDGLLLPPPRGAHTTRAYNELLRCETEIGDAHHGHCNINTLLED